MKKWLCLLFAVCCFCGAVSVAEDDFVNGNKENTIPETAGARSYTDFAVTGSLVWRVFEDVLSCTDVHTQEMVAELPLARLNEEAVNDLALFSSGDHALLCTACGADSDSPRVSLTELTCENGTIVPGKVQDVTATLAFLFGGKTSWLEVDMVSCSGGIYIAALDKELLFQQFLFIPDTGELRALGSQSLAQYTAVFPCGDGLLQISPDLSGKEELTLISLSDGARTPLGSVVTGSLDQPQNCVFDDANQTLFYQLNGVGYRAKVGQDVKPEAFCIAPQDAMDARYGALADSVYVYLRTDGSLVFQDASARMTSRNLRILDLTGADTVSEVLPDFNAAHPDYLASLVTSDNAEDVLTAMLNQSTDYDGYIVSLGSDLYHTLKNRGYLGSMAGSSLLASAVPVLPERIQSAVLKDGQLVAFPLAVYNTVLAMNVPAMTELSGLAREAMPTDWPGFMQLLSQLSESGLPTDGSLVLYEGQMPGEVLRSTFFSMIMQDCMLWLKQDDSRIGQLQMALLPALQAFETVHWENLGQEDDNWMGSDNPTQLLLTTEPEIAVMALDPGTEYWPLSLQAGGERLIPQDVSVLVINPWSQNAEGILQLAETVWEKMDIVTRMELDLSLSEPVVNTTYEEDVAQLEQIIPMYEQAIAAASDEEEKAQLTADLAELQTFLEGYKQNAAWLISENSIASYRAMLNQLAPAADEFWSEGAGDASILQFLDGMLPASQFVNQFASALQMSLLEAE